MNNIEIYIIVEGKTEQAFVRDILAPDTASGGIYLYPYLIGSRGHKGGDVRFSRAKEDVKILLKERSDTYISTMFDYFRIDSDWPGNKDVRDRIKSGNILSVEQKAGILEKAMKEKIVNYAPRCNPEKRFIPYIQMHEFEALLFSDADNLAERAGIDFAKIQAILNKYNNSPEEINDDPEKAPSKQLVKLNRRYRKVAYGKDISEAIKIPTIRAKCPHFDRWVTIMENLPPLM